MIYHFLVIDLLFFYAAVVSIFIGVVVLLKRAEPGGIAFACVMISISLWLIFRVFEGVAETVPEKVFWAKFEYLGITTLPIGYFVFSSQFSRKDQWVTPRNIILLLIVPIITLILVFTNEKHLLIWKNIYPAGEVGIDNLVYEHGIYFWFNWAYSYVLLFAGVARLVITFFNYPKEHRIQAFILIIATLIPWLGNLLYLMGYSPIKGMDLTPIGLMFSGVVLAISLYRGQIFEIVPVARNIIFEYMQEGILVLNLKGIIVDANKAASEILGIPGKKLIKSPLENVLAIYPGFLKQMSKSGNNKFEIKLDKDGERYVQVSVSSITTNIHPSGRLIVLQDITKRKNIELYEIEQRKFAEALAHMAATLNSSLDLDVVFERILDIIHEVVPHDAANIALIEDEKRLRFVKLKGYEKFRSKQAIENLVYIIDEIPDFKLMVQTNKAVVVTNTLAHSTWVTNPAVEWIRSYIGSPIVINGKAIGFINVDSSIPNFYTQEHAQRLKVFADEAAIAIQNARFVEELKQRNQDLTTLYEVGIAMTEGLDFQDIVSGLIKQLENFHGIDLFLLKVLDEGPINTPIFLYDFTEKIIKKIEVTPEKNNRVIDQIQNKRNTVYIPNLTPARVQKELIEIPNYPIESMCSFLGIPLLEGKKVIGIISVMGKQVDAFNEKQIRLLETIASQVSIILQNVRMYDRMKELAIIDELTGIYNRRFFYLAANKEIERSLRYDKSLSVILIDIDHYKEVNDHYGHIAGDKVLQKLTQVIQKELRGSDVLARYGGEEFLILLSDTESEAAIAVAERIRSTVENLRVKFNEDEISITISLGVTTLNDDHKTLQDIISSVDQALYSAKQKGRNRVEYIA